MPRPMLKQKTQTQTNNILNVTPRNEQKQSQMQMNKMQLDRLLRKKRSRQYMDALSKLDAGGHVHNQEKVKSIINAIKEEFPEVELAGVLLGFVSKCYLGVPYEVHSVDVTGNIIEHYQAGHVMPYGLEKARGIAIHGGYEVIEVYVDCCRAISSDGSVSVITG